MNKTVCSSVVPTSKKKTEFLQENTVELELAIVVQP